MQRVKLNWNYLIILMVALFLFAMGLFWYQRYQHQQQFLINYLPRGSWYYWQINFAQVDLVEELRQNLSFKKRLEDWLLTEGLPVNVWRGGYRISQLALVRAEINNKGQKQSVQAWLVYSPDDIHSLVATELEDYYCKFLNQHVALLTKSEELMRSYQPIKADLDKPWLDSLIDQRQAVAGGFIKLEKYFNSSFKGQSIWQDYLQLEGELSWVARAEDAGFKIIVNLPTREEVLINSQVVDSKKINSVKALPEGVGIWFNFKPQIAMELLNRELPKHWQIDPDKLRAFIEAKYQVHLNELYTFFEQPYYVIFRSRNQPRSLKNLFNMSNYEYAIVGEQQISDQALVSLKQIGSAYVAFKYPVERKKILPDGSQGWELVADSLSWPWQEQEVNDGELSTLKTPNYEISYFNYQGGFMLSNSEELIRDILLSGRTINLAKEAEREVWIESSFWRTWELGKWYEVEVGVKQNLDKLQLEVYFKRER